MSAVERHGPWRPTRARLRDTFLAALAPVAVCAVALGGLTSWAAAGRAGSPARVAVVSGRVFLPADGGADTSAYFRITNSGGSDDRLLAVTSTAVGAAYRADVDSAVVPAGGELAMSPSGLGVALPARAGWRAGDLVRFTLRFEHGGPVTSVAVVIRPGDFVG